MIMNKANANPMRERVDNSKSSTWQPILRMLKKHFDFPVATIPVHQLRGFGQRSRGSIRQ